MKDIYNIDLLAIRSFWVILGLQSCLIQAAPTQKFLLFKVETIQEEHLLVANRIKHSPI